MPKNVQFASLHAIIGLFNIIVFNSSAFFIFSNDEEHPPGPFIKLFSIPKCQNVMLNPMINKISVKKK